MKKLIILDFDGVLVDSEKIYFEKWKQASIDSHIFLTDEEVLSLRSLDKSLATLVFGSKEKYLMVREKRRSYIKDYLKNRHFELKEGVLETLEYLKNKGYTIVIASSSSLEMIEDHLAFYGLSSYITEVLSVKNVRRGKPYPDVYLEILSHYQFDPSLVVAIEDSPNGVTSAYQAKIDCVMIPDLTEPEPQLKEKTWMVLNSLVELCNFL